MTKVKQPRGSMTWDEYEAWLKETGQYEEMVERHRKPDEELEKRWAERDAALVPLEDELRASRCPPLSSMFSQTKPPNLQPAIPILLAHLQKSYPTDARVLIARALAVPEIKAYWDVLLQLYRDEREERVKHGLANAIVSVTDNKVLGDVIDLIRDKKNGVCRGILLYVLEKTKDPRGRAVMEELANDPDLAEQIAASLKHLDRLKIRQAQRQARKNPTRH